MDLMQAITERRSVRRYRGDPVTEADLNAVLEAARWAPSWANTQCPRFVVVRDPAIKERLAGTIFYERPEYDNPALAGFRAAPVAIVVCARNNISGVYRKGARQGAPVTDKGYWWFMFDAALASQNLTLAAHALSLGTVHICIFDAEQVRQILRVPPDLAVVELLALGWPAETPTPPPRKELSELVIRECFPPA